MYVFDYAGTLVFLLSLIAVSRFKKYVTANDKESYNHVVAGLAILVTVSLAQIYSGAGLFGQIPFLSDPLFFRLLFWIGMIMGLTFLINGVTNWVPLSRSYRKYNKERIQRLEFIKKVEQLLRVESRLPVVLHKSLEHMVETYDLTRGGVYLYSRTQRQVFPVNTFDRTEERNSPLKNISFDMTAIENDSGKLRGIRKLIADRPAGLPMPNMAVPIAAGEHVIGFFLLWAGDTAPLGDEDRMNLKIVGDIIGHEVCHDFLQLRQDFQYDLDRWTRKLRSRIDYRRSPQQNVSAIVDCMKEKSDFDYFSLCVIKEDLSAVRFTIGENAGLLTETNVDLSGTNSLITAAYVQGEPMYLNNVDTRSGSVVDEVIVRNGYSSVAVLPVKHGSAVEGVVTIASKKSPGFGIRERRFIEAAFPMMASIAVAEKYRLREKASERRGYVLNKFLNKVVELEESHDIFESAVNLIGAELKPSVVRISSVDRKGQFLESLALKTSRTLGMVTPARGTMILSLMPYHQLVLDTGRPMMINQQGTERRMTDAETRQIFGIDINSALLVPVRIGQSTVGIISLAETREWSRYQFRQDDIQFVSIIASALSVALQLVRKQKETDVSRPKTIGKFDPEAYAQTRVRSRIKSSLSGIMGSVEFLKGKKELSGTDIDKCLTIIDKSARRIGQYVLEEKK